MKMNQDKMDIVKSPRVAEASVANRNGARGLKTRTRRWRQMERQMAYRIQRWIPRRSVGDSHRSTSCALCGDTTFRPL